MKKELCKFAEQNLWKYIDRELSARRVSEISVHLKSCESCQNAYEERSRSATMYRLAFMGAPFDDEFAAKFRQTLDAELEANGWSESGHSESKGEFRGFLGHRRRFAVAVGVASVVVVLLALTWVRFSILMNPDPETRQAVTPRTSGEKRGTPSGASPVSLGHFRRGGPERGPGEDFDGEALYAGRVYDQDERRTGAYFELDDGSTLTFSAQNWSFFVREQSAGQEDFVADVHEGTVDVFVTPRASGSFVLVTPNAEVKVPGTEFNLRVEWGAQGETTTTVAVTEGEVKVTDLVTQRVFRRRPANGVMVFPQPVSPQATKAPETSEPPPLDMPRLPRLPR